MNFSYICHNGLWIFLNYSICSTLELKDNDNEYIIVCHQVKVCLQKRNIKQLISSENRINMITLPIKSETTMSISLEQTFENKYDLHISHLKLKCPRNQQTTSTVLMKLCVSLQSTDTIWASTTDKVLKQVCMFLLQ